MLTARPWPQPLLLTALFLLLTAAAVLLACGPVAQPAPAEGNAFPAAQQEGGDNAWKPGDPVWTPSPKPTATYPKIKGLGSGLHSDVVEFEEAQDAASGPSGQSGSAVEDSRVLVQIFLSANAKEIETWLTSNGVTPFRPVEAGDTYIGAEVPLSLLGALSQQDGVVEISQPEPSFLPVK